MSHRNYWAYSAKQWRGEFTDTWYSKTLHWERQLAHVTRRCDVTGITNSPLNMENFELTTMTSCTIEWWSSKKFASESEMSHFALLHKGHVRRRQTNKQNCPQLSLANTFIRTVFMTNLRKWKRRTHPLSWKRLRRRFLGLEIHTVNCIKSDLKCI